MHHPSTSTSPASCGPWGRAHHRRALLVLRDQVIKPILAGVRTPRRGRKPKTWSPIDQHYEAIRIEVKALVQDCGIAA
jgi:hypothetical protein